MFLTKRRIDFLPRYDAVNQFLIEEGGDVAIKLHAEKATRENFVPFALVITLPAEQFFVASEHLEQKK